MIIVLIEDDEVLSGSDAVEVLSTDEIQQNLMDSGIITEEFTAGMQQDFNTQLLFK